MFVSTAYAMGNPGTTGNAGTDMFMQFVPLILMIVIFYFLLIRPQQKRAKEHRAMLQALKKGDQIVTTGGIIGRITDIDGDMLTIEIGSKGTELVVGRAYVSGLLNLKAQESK